MGDVLWWVSGEGEEYKGEWDKKKFLFKRKISSGMGKDWRVHQEKGRIQKLL